MLQERREQGVKFQDGLGGTEIMRIDGANKRVDIGTSSPQAKLHVAGDGSVNLFHVSLHRGFARLVFTLLRQ